MIITKTTPVGIDIPIDRIQKLLYNGHRIVTPLSWVNSVNGYESYHRAYRNEQEEGRSGLRPEIYNEGREYSEVFYSDKFSATSFFLSDDVVNSLDGHLYDTEISIIFQLNLAECYPNITHRADEEAHKDVLLRLENNPWSYTINSMVTGINNVYPSLNIDDIRYTDMQPRHVFMVSMKIEFEYNC